MGCSERSARIAPTSAAQGESLRADSPDARLLDSRELHGLPLRVSPGHHLAVVAETDGPILQEGKVIAVRRFHHFRMSRAVERHQLPAGIADIGKGSAR